MYTSKLTTDSYLQSGSAGIELERPAISRLQTQYLHSLCLFNYEREESTNNNTCSLACTESSEHVQILTTVSTLYIVGPVVDPRFNSGVQPISTEDDHQRDQNVGSYCL